MDPVIHNAKTLSSSGLREQMLSIIEAAYSAIQTPHVLDSSIHFDGTTLSISPSHSLEHADAHVFNLNDFERVFIVGCGKVACAAAYTLEKKLGGRVKGGAVVGLTSHQCSVVDTYEGTHPLPSEVNFRATSHILDIGTQVTERDLVFAIISGGGSAMLCGSEDECTQGERLYKAFLSSGGTIEELNTVRRHLSPLKGGGLAKALHPATVVGLIFSDIPGGDPKAVASGPTYKDSSSIEDAARIIQKYNLGEFSLGETPKDDRYFKNVHNILLVSNETAVHAMVHRARSLGYHAIIPSCDPYAESSELIDCLFSHAKEKSIVCLGAEPRITIPSDSKGDGGRCSFTALQAISRVGEKQVFAAFSSDGRDNSDTAGALIDTHTLQKAQKAGVDLAVYLKEFKSNSSLMQTGDLIETGPLEANVSDLFVLLTA